MYRIVKESGETLGTTEEVNYIRTSGTGTYILTDRAGATGIAYKSRPYHLYGRPEMEGLETVLVKETDGGAGIDGLGALLGGAVSGKAAEQMRAAVQMYAAALTDEEALKIPAVYPEWETGRAYGAGKIVAYGVNGVGDPQLYRVVQAHTSQLDWTPDAAASLYDAFGFDGQGYPVWSQPAGAHDAYNAGDIVDYGGTLYVSLIDGNVWPPDAYPAGWQIYAGNE